jgi:L-ascorbate metabolism protein UlaG (beta-lactamase superfamily)
MDPNGLHPAPAVPDVITVSNLHETHRAVGPQLETAQILWGIHPVHGWQRFVRTIRDVTLFNVPSYGSRGELETSRVHNSIFVFRLGGLCVVHLGNLRHVLTRPQLEQIGTPDVVLVPVDGLFNLDYADIIKVITQLQPRLVVPMHIEVAQQAEAFVQYTAERYPVRRLAGRTLMLSQPQLPAETEIVRFGH